MFNEITTELLRRGNRVRFRAIGASMQPTIEDGELITVAPVALESVKRGDILLYQNERGVFAHRVVGLQAHRPAQGKDPSTNLLPSGEKAGMRGRVVLLLRGDAGVTCDPPVALEQVLGRVVAVQRAGRTKALDTRLANLLRLMRRWAGRVKRAIREV